jgi:peptidyl-tRNA hydrolase, PTH1 family
MFIFYGLGNNSLEYLNTKHNIGRIVVEELSIKLGLEFTKTSNYYFSKLNHQKLLHSVYFLYSRGFMNLSGTALLDFVNYFKLNTQELILVIIQDDSDQYSGNFKITVGGGSGGHRGIESIYRDLPFLNLDHVWRLKIGIRPVNNKQKSGTFVLNNLTEIDRQVISYITTLIFNNLNLFQTENLPKLQNLFNTKM